MTSSTPSRLLEGNDVPTDKELIARHVAGDPDAFADLFRRHRDRLWAVALRTLGDPEEAADALQDALVSAFRNAGQFRGESAVTTWLHRVVVNACLDRVRRRAVRAADPLPEDDRAAELAAVRPPDPAEQQELRIDIMSALDSLNADQRAAIVLVDMEGYSVDEAASMLDCAPGTIKSRCARGRARLVPLLLHLRDGRGQRDQDPGSSGNPTASSDVQGVPGPGQLPDPGWPTAPGGRRRRTTDRHAGEAR
ncbi:RNA polymerase sigma factor SigM [Actinopolymorpha sp. B17G11]|uniref:RNA polymerase sigma factor SigM n=1 Tax=unclassified Actinopolymorpha TaxID=2627063 RepID=UPI0032D986BC